MMKDLLSYDEDLGSRPSAVVPVGERLEDQQKTSVHVFHKGLRTPVSWFKDTPKADIKTALVYACDCIYEGGFELVELVPRIEFLKDTELYLKSPNCTITDTTLSWFDMGSAVPVDKIHELKNGYAYEIRPGHLRSDVQQLVGDRWRRLKVNVDPLLHVEATIALKRMQKGANLLKHTSVGLPHLRQFQLSADRKRLLWYTANKSKQDSMVRICDIDEICIGQVTSAFKKYPLPLLQHLSFSVMYQDEHHRSKSLDLTCKDEAEFDLWVTGLKALVFADQGEMICKAALLSHSRKFRKAIERQDASVVFSKLPQNVNEKKGNGSHTATLDDLIDVPTMTPTQLKERLKELTDRLKNQKIEANKIDRSTFLLKQQASRNVNFNLAKITSDGLDEWIDGRNHTGLLITAKDEAAYSKNEESALFFAAAALKMDEDLEDEETEIMRLDEIIKEVELMLAEVHKDIQAASSTDGGSDSGSTSSAAESVRKKKSKSNCRAEHALWKAEVDLENVEDILDRYRFKHNPDVTEEFGEIFKEVGTNLEVIFSNAWSGLLGKIDDVKTQISSSGIISQKDEVFISVDQNEHSTNNANNNQKKNIPNSNISSSPPSKSKFVKKPQNASLINDYDNDGELVSFEQSDLNAFSSPSRSGNRNQPSQINAVVVDDLKQNVTEFFGKVSGLFSSWTSSSSAQPQQQASSQHHSEVQNTFKSPEQVFSSPPKAQSSSNVDSFKRFDEVAADFNSYKAGARLSPSRTQNEDAPSKTDSNIKQATTDRSDNNVMSKSSQKTMNTPSTGSVVKRQQQQQQVSLLDL